MVNKTTKAMFKNATSCVVSALLAVSVFLGCMSAYSPELARATEDQDNTQAAMAVNDTPAKEEVQAPAPEAVAPEAPAAEAAPIPEAEVAPEAILPGEEGLGEQAEEGEAAQDTQESAAEEPGQQDSYPGSGEEAMDPAAVTPESNNEDATSSTTEGENKEAKDDKASKDDEKSKDAKDAEKPAAFEASQTVDGVVVSVKAEEGAFPKGSTLSVRKVSASEQSAAEAAVEGKRHEGENVAVSYTFDIKVLDKDKKEIQPAKGKKVEVAFKAAEVANQNLETNVYHLKKEGSLVAESLDTKEQGSTVSAQTTGFSYYTVEFTYGDLQYVMEGDSEIPLSTILDKIGLSGTVTAATSSNPELFSVENKGSSWTVTAKQAFCSEESLTLTIDGIDYVIKVTDDVTDDPHNHNHGTGWTAWNNTTSLPNTTGKYYLNTNVTLSNDFFFSNNVELCLNGHTITMNGSDKIIATGSGKKLTIYDEPGNSGGIVFNNNRLAISDNSVFNIYGGTFKGCTRLNDGALTINGTGIFNMYGGVFSGNKCGSALRCTGGTARMNIYGGEFTGNEFKYAPINVQYGAVYIYDVTISGNSGQYGGLIAGGNVYMSGGTITGNTGKEAAVYAGNKSLNLSGAVYISGNKLENGEECNVKPDSNNYRINIFGELTNTTPIGITAYTPPTGNNTVEFTTGLNGKGTAANFSSDNPNYAVIIKNNEAHLISHSHTFNYTAAGDTITAECVNTATPCSLPDNKTTLKIVKPALAKYGGTESAEATFEGTIPGVTPVAEYYKGTEKLDAAPTNAGTYKAQVTLKGSDEKEATAFVDYTIAKADITPVVEIENWNYGETAKTPSVTAASNPGSGAVTYKYYTDEACTKETTSDQGADEIGGVPSYGGDYWVKATVEETANYNSGTGTKGFKINATAVKVTGLKFGSKEYDGNTTATLDISEAKLEGVPSTEDVKIASATGVFDNKNVGTGKTISNITIVLSGSKAGGYSATADPDETVTGAITPCPVTVSGIKAKDKDYDGTTDATVDASKATFGGIVGDDELSITATGEFENANAGADKTVNLTLGELGGVSKDNYKLAESGNQETAKATIKPLPMAVKADGYDGIYDGGSHSITVTVTEPASGYTITYKGPDDGEYSEINPGFKNQGEYEVSYKVTAPNYETFTGTATVKIAKKSVTVSKIAANDKVYDGTVAAELEYKDAVVTGQVDGDNLTVSATGAFSDKNVGDGKMVAISGITLGGNDAGNYELAATGQQETATASITKRPVKVSGITAENKVYDGQTTATVKTDEAEFENIVSGDALTVSTTGTFDTKDAGEGKTVTFGDLALSGDSVANYELASEGQQADTTAAITPKPINVAAEAASKAYGEEDPELKYTGDSLIGEDAYTGALERVAGEEAGIYEIGQGSLTAGDNYEITYTPADFEITKALDNSVTAAIEGWTYGDAAKEPSATATYGQDTVVFRYNDAVDGTYTETVPTDAGTYFVKAYIGETPSYPAAESEPVEFTIAPKPVTPAMLSLDKESVKKAGSKQGPTITMTDGTVLVEGKDYTLSGDTTADKTGTHFFTVTGIGNYTSSFESSWYMYEDKQNAATEKGEDGAGNIEIFVDIVGNTESISVNNFTIDFAKALLSEADLSKRAEGANITLYVEVAEVPVGEVPETDRALLKAFFDGKGATDIRWFDIKVWKKVGNDPAAQIHELGSALELTISVPDDYKDAPADTTRTFYFGTAHNGVHKLLSETTDKAVSFSASEFSTFALAYKDVKASDAGSDGKTTKSPIKATKATTAKTADSANVPALTCLALVSSLLLAVATLRRRKEEEAK